MCNIQEKKKNTFREGCFVTNILKVYRNPGYIIAVTYLTCGIILPESLHHINSTLIS